MFSARVPRKSVGVLRHPRKLSPPGGGVAHGQVDVAGRHAPLHRLGETQEERGNRALAASARADERDRLTRGELEVDRVEHVALAARVRE